MANKRKTHSLVGMKFGRLTVTSLNPIRGRGGKKKWDCLCECGKKSCCFSDALIRGASKSCGCLNREIARQSMNKITKPTHRMTNNRVYRIWINMKERCGNPKAPNYHLYGGRGITVCDGWSKFENFYQDMGDPPSGHQIDRIDNAQGYYATNCRWATPKENSRNTRTNRLIKANGVTKTMAEWSELSGNSPQLIRQRINKGWDNKSAIFTPPHATPAAAWEGTR